jgi:flagellar hook assembly protein FlgD
VTALYRNAPNPFRGTTDIRYASPSRAQVNLGIYDVAGRHLRTLADGVVEPGSHNARWDGRDDKGGPVPPGVYFVRMTAPGFDKTRSLILLR